MIDIVAVSAASARRAGPHQATALAQHADILARPIAIAAQATSRADLIRLF
jgi:hypothetical protein